MTAGREPECLYVFDCYSGATLQVAMGSMPLYAALPAVTEAVVEAGWTRVYSRIADVGAPRYLAYFALYMASVEFFVYWMHRGLHDVKLGYRRAPAAQPFPPKAG